MNNKSVVIPIVVVLTLSFFFFYKLFLFHLVPIPGDLLVAEYQPFRSHSFLGYAPGSYPEKGQYFDVLRQMYPWKHFAISELKKGRFPLWNPYNFSGTPLFANFQSSVLYPLNFFYFILPFIPAWTVLILLQPILALIFMYYFMRKNKFSLIAALFAGVAYGFSSFMTVWLEYNTIGHVILWLPLLLLCIDHLLEQKTARWSLIFVFSLVASLFAGHIQVYFYVVLFSFFYLLFQLRKKSSLIRKENLSFTALYSLALGIGAIQLLPGIELIMLSARSAHDYIFLTQKILIQPYQLLMIFIPDFFGNPATKNYYLTDTYIGKMSGIGIIPLFFVLLSFISKNSKVRFFLFSSVVILLLTTLNPFSWLFYKIPIPIFSASAPTLMLFLLSFSLSFLCGVGIDMFRTKEHMRYTTKISLSLIVLLFLCFITLIFIPKLSLGTITNQQVSLRNLLYSSALVGILLVGVTIARIHQKLVSMILIILLIMQIGDSWRSFQKFNPFSPVESIFPKTNEITYLQQNPLNRFWGIRAANISSNLQTYYGISSVEGYDPLYSKRYGELILAGKDGKIHDTFTNATRSDAVITQDGNMKTNPYRLRILDSLGVTYILDKEENANSEKTLPIGQLVKVFEQNGWKIYRNTNSLPRLSLINAYHMVKTKDDFASQFFSASFDPAKTVLLEENPQIKPQSNAHGKITLKKYEPNTISLTTISDKNTFLLITDTWYPGWKAFIDGKRTSLYQANYVFLGVSIPSGKHSIAVVYDPTTFKIGSILSLLSILSVIFYIIYIKIQKKKLLYQT